MKHFTLILLTLYLFLVMVLNVHASSYKEFGLIWDDDLEIINKKKIELKRIQSSSSYVPYNGKYEVCDFLGKEHIEYIYPEQAKITKENRKKEVFNKIFFPKELYTGVGFIIKNEVDLDFSKNYANGYLYLKIKLLSDVNNVKIALVQQQSPRIESSIDLKELVDTKKKGWQEVKIFLDKFLPVGQCWDNDNQVMIDGTINMHQINEVKFFSSQPLKTDIEFEVKALEIMDDGSNLVKKTFKGLYKESLQDLSYSYSYPKKSKLKDSRKEKKNGSKSLEFSLDTNQYSGIGLGVSNMDLSKNRDNLYLEFWIKGKNGGEKVNIGFADSDDDHKKTKGLISLNKYVIVTNDWQKVTLPLKVFPVEGKFVKGTEEISEKMAYDKITELCFASNPKENKQCVIYLDDVRIYKE